MSEANQTATPIDAREASMSRVQTLDSLLGKTAPADPPKADSDETKVETVKADEPNDGQKRKQTASERISEVIAQRKAAEESAADAKREAAELKAQLDALKVRAEPLAPTDRPQRATFSSQEEFEDALTDWKADQRIAQREKDHAAAQAKAEFEAVEQAHIGRVEAAAKEIDDFSEVVGAAEMPISEVAAVTIKRSKFGPQVLYFLAKNPDEVKKLNRMHAIDAVTYVHDLGKELTTTEKPEPVKPSKAPAPFTPSKASAAPSAGPASTFEEHRARRRAEEAAKK